MSEIDPKSLPQSNATWYFTMRRLRTWVLDDDKDPQRPYFSVLIDLDVGAIRGSLLGEKPNQDMVRDLFLEAMNKSEEQFGFVPERPARLFFEDRAWREALTPYLREIGIESKYRSIPELSNELFAEVEEHLNPDHPEFPGLLSVKGVNTKMVKSLFEAAAEFYRNEPWIHLSNDDLLAISVPPQKDPWYAIVMGQAGVEYGLALYKTWQDVERQNQPMDRPSDFISPSGHHALTYNAITEVSFEDLDAIDLYGWEVAEPGAYPVPLVFTSLDALERPDRETLLWYEAAMRAIPQFVADHLAHGKEGRSLPIEAQMRVKTGKGDVSVHIKYPGGELPTGARGYRELSLGDFLDPKEPPFDRRVMERDMARLTSDLREDNPLGPEATQAQDLMYQAWEERNPAQRIALAHKALKISDDCADAYVLLAEEEAENIQQALNYYRQGVEAGKRALGERYFEENEGHFWGLLETRPYMRAMEGMAFCLWEMKQHQDALEVYQEMLRLNPGDNQGVRHTLVELLLDLNREPELEALLDAYAEEWSAVWNYTSALLAFRRHGDASKSRAALENALDQNPHVPEYLIGKKRIPNRLPDFIGFGDEREAIVYAANHINHWRRTPGAVDWLKKRASGKAIRKRQAERKSNLNPGDSVAVKPGVIDIDDGSDLSGWQGRVLSIDLRQKEPMAHVAWDAPTMQGMSPEYIKFAAEEGLDWSEYIIPIDDLIKAKARDSLEEREATFNQIKEKYAYAHLGEQGQRIQDFLDSVQSRNEAELFKAWDAHLRQNMQLPVNAIFSEPVKGIRLQIEDEVKITAFENVDREWGVMVRVEKGKRSEIVPLSALEPGEEETPSMELLDDYLTWYIKV